MNQRRSSLLNNSVFVKIKPGGVWYDKTELGDEDIAQLENPASFCEKLKYFHDRGILDWETLDLMFRNRFFLHYAQYQCNKVNHRTIQVRLAGGF